MALFAGRARVFNQMGDDKEEIQIALEVCPVNCIHWVRWAGENYLTKGQLASGFRTLSPHSAACHQVLSGISSLFSVGLCAYARLSAHTPSFICAHPQVTLPQLPLLEVALAEMPRIDAFMLMRSGGAGGNVFWVSEHEMSHTQAGYIPSTKTRNCMLPGSGGQGAHWAAMDRVRAGQQVLIRPAFILSSSF